MPKILILITRPLSVVHRLHRLLRNLWMVFSVRTNRDKTFRNLPPAVVLSHSRGRFLAQLERMRAVNQYAHDGVGKGNGVIGQQQLDAVRERQSFSADCS